MVTPGPPTGAAVTITTISLDSGTGPVVFAVRRPARPCAWRVVRFGPGAQRAPRGRSGVRCTPPSDGVLTLGPATFRLVAGADAAS